MRAEEGQDMEIGEVQEKKKVKYRLAGSIGVKLLAFWLLIISGIIFCGAFGIGCFIWKVGKLCQKCL